MSDKLTVAVVIPVYNCAPYIEEALGSIEAQTRRPDRVVVVDDGSTDGSGEIASAFAASSAMQVQVVKQENAGIAAARNVGVARCSEDLIAFLDGDDTFYPPFIERAANALARHDELLLCFLDRDVVDAEGAFLRHDLDHPGFRAIPAKRLADGTSVLTASPFVTLAAGNVIPIGLMVRRSAFVQVGGFDSDQRMVEDKPFLMRLAKLGPFGFLDEPLGTWRRHGTNTSGAGNAFKMVAYDDLALAKLECDAQRLNLTTDELASIRVERRKNPARLLYAASDGRHPEFFPLVLRLIRERRLPWSALPKSCIRYALRHASRGKRPTLGSD